MINTKLLKIFNQLHNVCKRSKSYSSGDYCLSVVRAYDNENFLCSLRLPAKLRATSMAIRAFNAEVATVQDQVSQPHLGAMRLKFWDECIDKIYNNKVPNNPVAVELSKAVKRHSLSKELLKKIVVSRIRRLDQTSFSSVREMEKHADASCSSVYLLLLEAADDKSQKAQAVARSLGTAQGLTNLLRGVPHNASKRILTLPSDLLAHHNIVEEDIFRGKLSRSINTVVKIVAESAMVHLHNAHELKGEISSEIRRIFLPAVSVEKYLRALQNSSFDIFDNSLQNRGLLLPLLIFYRSIINDY